MWISRSLLVYSDDGLLLLPAAVALAAACTALTFLVALGVPLSWTSCSGSTGTSGARLIAALLFAGKEAGKAFQATWAFDRKLLEHCVGLLICYTGDVQTQQAVWTTFSSAGFCKQLAWCALSMMSTSENTACQVQPDWLCVF